MFFNLPTLLTWARIVAIPLIVGVFYLQIEPGLQNLGATVLFVVVALTDWLDGYLARRLNMTSSFGAFLDPVADKFLVCAALLVLVHLNRLHALVAFVIIGREIAISRPMMTSATSACSRFRCTSTSKAAQTRNLSATGSRKAPNDEVMLSRRAR